MKKLLSMLMAFCLTLAIAAPGLGQDAEPGITEQAFSALVREAFPGYQASAPGNADAILTYERALTVLCEALGISGQSPAQALAFAIENDLIPGVAYAGGNPVAEADARAMIAAFAACRDMEKAEETMYLMQSTLSLTGAARTSGMAPMSMESEGFAIIPLPYVDYNSLNDESYGNNEENRFLNPVDSPFSTFALDVDTASYSNIRRCLLGGYFPDLGAIRIEEMLNYFDYDLHGATKENPVSITTELNVCPWNKDHLLAMIALSGYAPDKSELPGSNLVFLVDVSGSMEQYNRLPLARQALKLLVSQLSEKDTVSIVTYAGSVGTLLAPTAANKKETINLAIDSMYAGGSTNGAGGIEAAYAIAREAFIDGGNNRVILLTDGDFNVGVQSASELEALIEAERESGVYLSVLGFGMGNLKDYEMETLADKGNGNYAYIDTLKEAKKVFVDDMTGTIFTVAKDVKLQVEFNPEKVASYRLIGYENRLLNTEDFTDDTKDAGEMGAGHQMIALYEIVPAVETAAQPTTDSRYQERTAKHSDETLYVSVRYKLPDSEEIIETGSAIVAEAPFGPMSETMAFAAAVAEFGLLLKDSEYKADAGLNSVLARAMGSRGEDAFGYRAEFVQLVSLSMLLKDQ
ncbi:MAG: VWA domain-containing protein [Bacillota bacterium]